jgi:hypothetical protein
MKQKVLVIGLGGVGGYALHLLARQPGIEIIGADIRDEFARSKVSNVYYDVFFQRRISRHPHIYHKKIDLNNVEETARTLKEIKPDVILSQATLQSYWVVHHIPEEIRKQISDTYPGAGLGVWTPMHLTLPYKLMQAVRKANIDTHVVNGSFSDCVNAALSKVGLAPTVGMGNFALLEPYITRIVGEKLSVPPDNVSVSMVGHHAMCLPIVETGTARNTPYYLKIRVFDEDVTSKFDIEKDIWSKAPMYNPPEPLGGGQQEWIASSATRNVLAILFDTGEIVHAPGPQGLPGGYPVRLNGKGAEVVLPAGLSRQEAIKINEEAQKFDGIERITDDGTVVCTDHAARIMEEVLGYECKEINLASMEKKAKELSSAYSKLVSKYEVKK